MSEQSRIEQTAVELITAFLAVNGCTPEQAREMLYELGEYGDIATEDIDDLLTYVSVHVSAQRIKHA